MIVGVTAVVIDAISGTGTAAIFRDVTIVARETNNPGLRNRPAKSGHRCR